jgi:hypothetical protein
MKRKTKHRADPTEDKARPAGFGACQGAGDC